jgi:hypothetical protein
MTPYIQAKIAARTAQLSGSTFAGEHETHDNYVGRYYFIGSEVKLTEGQTQRLMAVGMTQADIDKFLQDGAPPSNPTQLEYWVQDIIESKKGMGKPPTTSDYELDESSKGFTGAASYTKTPESQAAYDAAKARGVSEIDARTAANEVLAKTQGTPVKWGEWSRGWRPGPLEIGFGVVGLLALVATFANWKVEPASKLRHA